MDNPPTAKTEPELTSGWGASGRGLRMHSLTYKFLTHSHPRAVPKISLPLINDTRENSGEAMNSEFVKLNMVPSPLSFLQTQAEWARQLM